MKTKPYKTLRNIGGALMIAGLSYVGYQLYKAKNEENEELHNKHLMNTFYGFLGTYLVGGSAFLFGEYKQNKLENKLNQNE